MKPLVATASGLPLLAMVLAPMAPAFAQADSTTQSTTPSASVGPESSGLGLGSPARSNISFNLNARYDSNVPKLNDDAVNITRLVREDVRVSPSVQLDVARNLGRHQIGIRALLGYDFYLRDDTLNQERLIIEPSAYLDLPVCDISAQGFASRQQSDLGQIVYFGIAPTAEVNNTETTKRITGQFICGEAYGFRPTLTLEAGSGFNSNPFRRIADYEVTKIQPGVGYSSPGLGEISIYAFKQDTDLPNQIGLNGLESGYTLRGYGVQYRRNIGTRLDFNGSLSHVDVTPYDVPSSGRSGLNASVSVTFLASDRLQFVGYANRNFTSTLTALSTYQLDEGYGLSATYAATPRVRLRAGGSVSPQQFFYTIQPVGPFISEQTQYDIFAGASYDLNRRIRLDLDAGYQKRDANLDLFDYESFFVGVGLSFSL